MSAYRLSSGGVIDRNREIAFKFDGKSYSGYAGDTLASALMALNSSAMYLGQAIGAAGGGAGAATTGAATGAGGGAGGVGVRLDDRELIRIQTRQCILFAQSGSQSPRDATQQLVADCRHFQLRRHRIGQFSQFTQAFQLVDEVAQVAVLHAILV
mgnify:CR=1 FL=1